MQELQFSPVLKYSAKSSTCLVKGRRLFVILYLGGFGKTCKGYGTPSRNPPENSETQLDHSGGKEPETLQFLAESSTAELNGPHVMSSVYTTSHGHYRAALPCSIVDASLILLPFSPILRLRVQPVAS